VYRLSTTPIKSCIYYIKHVFTFSVQGCYYLQVVVLSQTTFSGNLSGRWLRGSFPKPHFSSSGNPSLLYSPYKLQLGSLAGIGIVYYKPRDLGGVEQVIIMHLHGLIWNAESWREIFTSEPSVPERRKASLGRCYSRQKLKILHTSTPFQFQKNHVWCVGSEKLVHSTF
jgi:hypothetical protein